MIFPASNGGIDLYFCSPGKLIQPHDLRLRLAENISTQPGYRE